MHWKLTLIFLLTLVAESTFARLQGHHRRHAHSHHHHHAHVEKRNPDLDLDIQARGLIDGSLGLGLGPLTATLGVDLPGATLPPGKPPGGPGPGPEHPHHHGGPPHGGPPHGDHPQGHPHGGPPGGPPHGGPPGPHGGPPGSNENYPHDNNHHPHPLKPTADWDRCPSDGKFSHEGFGKPTKAHGDGVSYVGNVGDPWGSNMIIIPKPEDASKYKYVAQFHGSKNKGNNNKRGDDEDEDAGWKVVIWNKIGPDGKMTGWYGHSALNFTIGPDEIVYVAFDENSQGGWAAAPGSKIPTDQWGGYSSTWGEFDMGSEKNGRLSGWDVSCIQAQNAKQTVQGMRICLSDGDKCSTIEPDARKVENAYTGGEASVDGLGGTVSAGAVRLVVELDYQG